MHAACTTYGICDRKREGMKGESGTNCTRSMAHHQSINESPASCHTHIQRSTQRTCRHASYDVACLLSICLVRSAFMRWWRSFRERKEELPLLQNAASHRTTKRHTITKPCVMCFFVVVFLTTNMLSQESRKFQLWCGYFYNLCYTISAKPQSRNAENIKTNMSMTRHIQVLIF